MNPVSTIDIRVHESVFPARQSARLVSALRGHLIPPSALYQTHKQAALWIELHRAFSPWITRPESIDLYRTAFSKTAARYAGENVRLVSLGCGDGAKDRLLMDSFSLESRSVGYVACDSSLPLLLTAAWEAARLGTAKVLTPWLADLGDAPALETVVPEDTLNPPRLLLGAFGLIPNFEPGCFFELLSRNMGSSGLALFSANLAPGSDYLAGIQSVLPQYDNAHTRAWLLAALADLGFDPASGHLEFRVVADPTLAGLDRIQADFALSSPGRIRVHGETIEFNSGDRIRVFYSYRYTSRLVDAALARHRMKLVDSWISRDGEEGLFLARIFPSAAQPQPSASAFVPAALNLKSQI